MKRLLAFLVAMLLTVSVAFADVVVSEMTDEELYNLINLARNELSKRNDKKEYFVDDSIIRIAKTNTGNLYEYSSSDKGAEKCFAYGITISNVSDAPYEVTIDNIGINGWETDTYSGSSGTIRNGMNKQFYIELIYSDAQLDNYHDMKDITARFTVKSNGKTLNTYTISFEFHGDDWK